MFVVLITYKKSIDIIDQYLAAHRSFLEDGYKNNYFIASGPQNPRTGGVILSQLNDRTQLENILKNDPFLIHDIATYEFIEFTPVKFHSNFAKFVNQ